MTMTGLAFHSLIFFLLVLTALEMTSICPYVFCIWALSCHPGFISIYALVLSSMGLVVLSISLVLSTTPSPVVHLYCLLLHCTNGNNLVPAWLSSINETSHTIRWLKMMIMKENFRQCRWGPSLPGLRTLDHLLSASAISGDSKHFSFFRKKT